MTDSETSRLENVEMIIRLMKVQVRHLVGEAEALLVAVRAQYESPPEDPLAA